MGKIVSENLQRIRDQKTIGKYGAIHGITFQIPKSSGIFEDAKLWESPMEKKDLRELDKEVDMSLIYEDGTSSWTLGWGVFNIVKALRSQKYRDVAIRIVKNIETEIPGTEEITYEPGKTVTMMWLSQNIRKK